MYKFKPRVLVLSDVFSRALAHVQWPVYIINGAGLLGTKPSRTDTTASHPYRRYICENQLIQAQTLPALQSISPTVLYVVQK